MTWQPPEPVNFEDALWERKGSFIKPQGKYYTLDQLLTAFEGGKLEGRIKAIEECARIVDDKRDSPFDVALNAIRKLLED